MLRTEEGKIKLFLVSQESRQDPGAGGGVLEEKYNVSLKH